MLKLKELSEERVINGKEIIIIGIRKSQKSDWYNIRKSQKLRKLILISLFNPRFCIEFDEILRAKGLNLR